MRVALVNTLYPPFAVGGAERSVEELARGLRARGHEVAVVTLVPRASAGTRVDVGTDGVQISRIPLQDDWPFDAALDPRSAISRLGWHAREASRVLETAAATDVLRAFGPDLLHTNNLAGFGTRVWGLAPDVPHVHTLRDYYLMCVRTTRYREGRGRCAGTCLDCRVLTRLRLHARRRPDVVVGLTPHIVELHRSAGVFPSDQPYRVIGNAPTPVEVPPRRVEQLTTVGFLGRFEGAKGLPLLVEAVRAAEGVRLVVAGRGTAEQEALVRERTGEDPRVVLLGHVPPAELLQRIDVLAVPTQWDEPYGRVAAEARSAGVPVLASAVGGLPHALAGDARSRLVDRFDDPRAWTDALEDLRARWQPVDVGGPPRWTGEDVTAAYESLFLELLGSPRSAG